MPENKSIEGVEIFSTGRWNGTEITHETLNEIVKAFGDTKETVKPFLKLGHNDEQALLKADGLPAAGWIENLSVKGNKLLADFVNIPIKVFELLKHGAYKKVSCEIYSGISLNGKKYPNLLGAVALLGAEMPAVMNLSDILSQYKKYMGAFTEDNEGDNISLRAIEYSLEEDMSEKNLADELRNQLDEQKVKLEEQTAALEEYKATLDSKDKELADSQSKLLEVEKQAKIADVEKFACELEAKKLVSPSMKPFIKELISVEKQEFAIDEKKFSSKELVTELLTLAKEVYKVNTEETSEVVEPNKDPEAALEIAVNTYAKEHQVDLSTAYRAVAKENKGE